MASNSSAVAFVEARLAYEIDVVAASLAQADGTGLIVDTRRQQSWDKGHIAGAQHLPSDQIDDRLTTLPRDRILIVYGWGPGCNGATQTARRLLGGYEYWVRNGFAVECDGVVSRQAPGPLVTAEG